MSLKFEAGAQLSLEGSVSRAPVVLKAVAFLPLLPFRCRVQGDLGQLFKLVFSLGGSDRGRRERAPGGLKLRVEHLELGGGRR